MNKEYVFYNAGNNRFEIYDSRITRLVLEGVEIEFLNTLGIIYLGEL